MDRYEREQLVEKLRRENVAMRANMAQRRERSVLDGEPEQWCVPEQSRKQRDVSNGLTFKTHDNALVETSQLVDDAFLQRALERTVEIVGEEVHRLVNKQADEITTLHALIGGLAERISALEDQVAALEGDVADVIDRSGGKVTTLKRRSDAA